MGVEAFVNGIAFPITADIKGLVEGLGQVDAKLTAQESAFKRGTEVIQDWGVKVGVAATAAGVAIVALTDSARETNAKLSVTAITLGTTTENVRDLTLSMSNANDPIEEVAATLDLLARAGVRGDEDLSSVAESMDLLGHATGNTADGITDSMIPVLNAFDIPLTEVGDHIDGLTYLTRNSTIDFTDFASTMSSLGPKLAAVGLTLEDTEAMMLALADSGYQGSAATKKLRMAITDANSKTDEYATALSDLKDDSDKLNDTQKDLVDTQKDLVQTQKDLTTSTRDTSLSLQENALSLADAQDELDKMIASGKDEDETTEQYNRRVEEQRLRIVSLTYAHDDLITKQDENKTKVVETSQALVDNATAQKDNTKAIADNATAQSDLSTKMADNETKINDIYTALGITADQVAAYKLKIDGATGATETYAAAAESGVGTLAKIRAEWDKFSLSVGTSLEPLSGVGTALSIGGPLILGLTQLPALIGGVNAAMLFLAANPIVLVIAAVAALVLGLYYLEVKFQWIEALMSGLSAGWGILWSGMVSTIQGAASMIGNIVNSMTSSIKWGLNIIIDGINGLIWGVNSVSSVGGLLGTRFNLPTIPHLASGGIVTQPTVALIGEAGPEAVVPLSGSGAGSMGDDIHDNTFIIREEADIGKVAKQLYTLIEQGKLNRGVSG